MTQTSKRKEVRVEPHTQVGVPLPWPAVREGPRASGQESEARGLGLWPLASGPRPGERYVLVAGVGYGNLRDLSAGPILIERLRQRAWPPRVQVEDLSFGAVAVLHWLQQQEPGFDAAILIAAVERGREPGTITRYTWTAPHASGEEVQARVAEAVTGVISLDTLLMVLSYFGALPPWVLVFEIEPLEHDWGPTLSRPVEMALEQLAELVEQEVHTFSA